MSDHGDWNGDPLCPDWVQLSVAGSTFAVSAGDSSGDNTFVWNGLDSNGQPVNTAVYPISFVDEGRMCFSPQDGYAMPNANLSLSVASSFSYTTGSTSALPIPFTLSEPVPRKLATSATVTALIYDSDGDLVKTLADGVTTNNINNQANQTNGSNSWLQWDGTDDSANPVDADTYTLTLFAKDNAGVGCESNCVTSTITVTDGQPDTSPFIEIDDDMDSPPGTVYGSTNQAGPVSWSDAAGGQGTATVDSDGTFQFTINPTSGEHLVTAVVTGAESQLDLYFNQLSISDGEQSDQSLATHSTARLAPASASKMRSMDVGTSQGQSVSIIVNSQTTDTVDVEITDPFQANSCISVASPITGADLLNGALPEPAPVRQLSNITLSAGSNAITWDALDSAGAAVSPGIYRFEVTSQHQYDGNDVVGWVTVSNPTSGLTITNVQAQAYGARVAVLWSTNVPAYGCVSYRADDSAIASVISTDNPSLTHTVWLPDVAADSAYQFYVQAWNGSGNTSVTTGYTVTSGDGPCIFEISSRMDSSGNATVKWNTDIASTSKVSYRKVWPTDNPNWTSVEDDTLVQDHGIVLSNLQANAEYVYRITSANGASQADSKYLTLVTQSVAPTINIAAPENLSTVSGLVSIDVEADSSCPRFTTTGIQSVELTVDGNPVALASHDPNGTTWLFNWDTSLAGGGTHHIVATATDDYWNTSDYAIDALTSSTQAEGMAVSTQVRALNTTSGTTSTGSGAKKAAVVVSSEVPQPLDVPFYPQGGWQGKGKFNHSNGGCGRASQQMLIWYFYRANGLDNVYRQNNNNAMSAPSIRPSADYINTALKALNKSYSTSAPTNYTNYSAAAFKKSKNPLQPVIRSLQKGYPAMVYTNIYGGNHIFILTGTTRRQRYSTQTIRLSTAGYRVSARLRTATSQIRLCPRTSHRFTIPT